MPAKRNNIVPNQHFHKDWQNYVKTWFNQVSPNLMSDSLKCYTKVELSCMIFLFGI